LEHLTPPNITFLAGLNYVMDSGRLPRFQALGCKTPMGTVLASYASAKWSEAQAIIITSDKMGRHIAIF
jgi:hypothetical protein